MKTESKRKSGWIRQRKFTGGTYSFVIAYETKKDADWKARILRGEHAASVRIVHLSSMDKPYGIYARLRGKMFSDVKRGRPQSIRRKK